MSHVQLPRWLESTEAQRVRQVEIERRILPIKLVVALVLWVGLALLALSFPVRDVLLTAACGVAYMPVMAYADRRLPRSRVPLVWIVLQEIGIIGVLAFTITWSGGVHSPALPMTMPVAIIMGTRFPLPWLVPLATVAITAFATAIWIGDPEALRAAPVEALAWCAAFAIAAALVHMLAGAERRARKDAIHDALTGVLNRKALEIRLADSPDGPTRRAETVSVIAADLDGFKEVNDHFGHEAGDDVLREVATTLAGDLRAEDVLYRLGGDEFLVILPATPTSEAAELAERLRATVAALRPGGHDVTLSLGVAGVVHTRVDREHLISRADGALYAAKAAGRNPVGIADPAGAPVPAAG